MSFLLLLVLVVGNEGITYLIISFLSCLRKILVPLKELTGCSSLSCPAYLSIALVALGYCAFPYQKRAHDASNFPYYSAGQSLN